MKDKKLALKSGSVFYKIQLINKYMFLGNTLYYKIAIFIGPNTMAANLGGSTW